MSTQAELDAFTAEILAFVTTVGTTPPPVPAEPPLDISAAKTAFEQAASAFTAFVASFTPAA